MEEFKPNNDVNFDSEGKLIEIEERLNAINQEISDLTYEKDMIEGMPDVASSRERSRTDEEEATLQQLKAEEEELERRVKVIRGF